MYRIFFIFLVFNWMIFANDGVVTPKTSDAENLPEASAIEGEIWGALVYALPAGKAAPSGTAVKSEVFDAIKDRLAKSSPEFASFQFLGADQRAIYKEFDTWVVPTKQFFMRVDSLGISNGDWKLNIQLWHDKDVLLKTTAIISKERPLFITGPKWGDGKLIFVLVVPEK